jgi:hypothetical protein
MTSNPSLASSNIGSDEMAMSGFIRFFVLSLPMVVGIICTLTALAFLADFASFASLTRLEDGEYVGFLIFALIGIPLTLFGIDRLSGHAA